MIAVSDADRAKAAELVGPWWDFVATSEYADNLRDCLAAALAEARAPYDRLTADLRALVEEWEGGQAEALASMRALYLAERPAMAEAYGYRANAYAFAAARLRAVVVAVEGVKA